MRRGGCPRAFRAACSTTFGARARSPIPTTSAIRRLAEWVPERSWIYRRRVSGGRIRFAGVDHEATVLVDGEEVAHHVGAFTPFEVDVPEGEHQLAVVVHAAPESEAQVGRTSRVRVHKSRMGYGWDFCPRLVHQGIWRSVRAGRAAGGLPAGDARGRRRDGGGRRRGRAARRVAGALVAERAGRAAPLSRRRLRCRFPNRRVRGLPLRRQRGADADPRLELGADRRAVRRAAAGEARAPARARRAREREPAARVGRRPDRERRVLRPLRPARAARLAGVHPVELGDRERALRRSGVRRDDGCGRARDRPAPAPPSVARPLVRWQRARRRRFDARARRAARGRPRARPRPRLVADVADRRAGRARAVGAPGTARAQRALRHADVAAAQRVRRRGHDEPARARGADRRGASLAVRPLEPGVRAPRRVVEQRAARAGGVRRPDRGRRHDAARKPVAPVRRACATRSRRPCAAARASSRGSSTSRSRTPGARARSTTTASRSPPTTASRARIAALRARSSRRARGAGSRRLARVYRARRASSISTVASSPSPAAARSRRRSTRSPTTCSCSTSTDATAT